MPTYEYECPKGHAFEVFQRMTDDPFAECPECGAGARRKISGGAGFLFKGEGFYITDSRSDDYKKKASEEGKSSSGKGSSDKPDAGKGQKDATTKGADKASKGSTPTSSTDS